MSLPVEVADAVVSLLNAGSFVPSFTAERNFAPDPESFDLSTLAVYVVPRGIDRSWSTRAQRRESPKTSIVVMKKVGMVDNQPDPADVEPLIDLSESIVDYLEESSRRDLDLASGGVAGIEDAQYEPLYYPEHLLELGLFVGVITLTTQTHR